MKPQPKIELRAAITLKAAKRKPTFAVRVYSGGPMRPDVSPVDGPIVVDLAGVTTARDNLPVLLDHNQAADAIVGQTTRIALSQAGIDVEGVFAGGDVEGTAAYKVLALARDGFNFMASVGMRLGAIEFIPDGVSLPVNGRTVAGPVYVARQGLLFEISLLSIGADADATVRIAARRGGNTMGKTKFENWLEAVGFTVDELNDAQLTELQTMFASAQSAKARKQAGAQDVKARRERVAAIGDVLAHFNGDYPELIEDIEAAGNEALADETWTPRDLEARLLRLCSRSLRIDNTPRSSHQGVSFNRPRETLAAAYLLHTGAGALAEKSFGADVCQAAAGLGIRHLLDLAEASCRMNPAVGAVPAGKDDVIRAAFGPSTYSLPSALGLAGEKLMESAYQESPASWRSWCGKRAVNTFREHTSIRPYLAGGGFDPIAPGGELKHATAGEETFTYKVDTFGRIFTVDRRDLVNDDLGAFNELFGELGRQAPRKIADLLYGLLLENPGAFFATGNNNYDDGADTALTVYSMSLAVTLLRKQTDADGKPIALVPRVLLVAPEEESNARQIITSTMVSRADDQDQAPVGNPWANFVTLEVEPRLSDPNFHANASVKAWYLFAGPVNPVAVVAFLGGREFPTVEQLDAPANVLGKTLRGYLDFGVALADKRAGVMMKGEN